MKIGTGLMANGPLPRTSMKRAAMLALGLAVVFAQVPGQAAQAPLPGDSLPYANGYLVTGGYVDGFVDLQQASGGGGFVSGTINIGGVPDQADVLAAWLYWETIVQTPSQLTGVEFNGTPINVNDTTVVKQSPQTLSGPFASCWASNGQQPTFTMYQMRADVRKLLPLQLDAQGFSTGKRLANGSHTVKLPENGTGNHVPQSAGASLVVVYRDTRAAGVREPLRKIVIYDGISVLPDLPGAMLSQTIRGIYKSESGATKFAKITHLGGSGQPNGTDRMFFYKSANTQNPQIATDPFGGTSSASDRSWSNKTVDVTSFMPGSIDPPFADPTYGETVKTTVDHTNQSPYDCLAWGAVIFETTEADIDHDGIPDGIEDYNGALKDADGTDLPNLHAMGSGAAQPSSTHPDIFIEMDAMFAPAGTTYGDPGDPANNIPSSAPYKAKLSPYTVQTPSVTTTVLHDHRPTSEVLRGLIDALTGGPTTGTNAGTVPHFDVGDPTSYINALGPSYAPYFVPLAAQPKGGQLIEEKPCGLTFATDCKFHFFPGTVGWQTGYNAYAALMFDKNRNGYFHWIFYVHANGRSRSLLPCLDASNKPTGYGSGTPGICAVKPNPNFNVPTTQSGVAQLPGSKVMISVGLWDQINHVGSTGTVTGTTLHELGHNLELYHGGAANTWNSSALTIQREANCKPNYLSVMSYIFQMPGLLDDLGNAHYRYSKEDNSDLFENSIVDGFIPPNPLPFRTAWFAPLTAQTALFGSSVAQRYCSGGQFGTTVPVDTVRLDGPLVAQKIDWLLNGQDLNAISLDVNFDGATNVSPIELRGFNDWDNLRLDQVGGGKGAFGFSAGSTGDGGGSTGDGGGSTGDGGGSTGDGGGSTGDGGGSTGDGGGSTGDGGGSTGDGGGVHMTLTGFGETGHAPPNPLKACVIESTGACTGTSTQLHRVKLEWGVPAGDPAAVARYHVYRWRDDDLSTVVEIADSPVTTGTSVVDSTELPHNHKFSYIVKADFTDGSKSGASVEKFITAVNLPPAPVADGYVMLWNTTLTIPGSAGPVVLGVVSTAPGYDTDTDSYHTSLRAVTPQASGPVSGTTPTGTLTLSADGGFTYTPPKNFFGNVTFTYNANDGTWTDVAGSVPMSADSTTAATVTIQVKKKL
jgi:hypothetical protein